MRCPLIITAASTAAACMVVPGLWGGGAGRAQPPGGNIASAEVHLTASVDNIGVNPPGDRTPDVLMTFSHAVQVSGDYSVDVGGNPIRSGQAVAGFLLGCGIDTAGVSVGIGTGQRLATGNSAGLPPPSVAISAPAGVGRGPHVRGLLGLGQLVGVSLVPGQVTTVSTAQAMTQTTSYGNQFTF